MIYRVVVLCEGWANAAKTKPVRKREKVLVDSVDSDQAMRTARDWAEMNAQMGPKWISFEPVECAPCRLPVLVSNI